MTLPTQPLSSNAHWPDIYEFQRLLRDFVDECYPNNGSKAGAAWEYVKDAKIIGTIAQQTGAGQSDVIARFNAIWVVLDAMKTPNAVQLQKSFNFNI